MSGAARTTSRGAILAICCAGVLLVSLDNTVVNVALPRIGHDLHADVASLQWVVAAYILVLASLLLLAGSLADRFGRKRIFLLGLAVFVGASVLCSTSGDVHVLVASRVLQAVGGAMLTPVALAIISATYPDPALRARAIGWWGATSGIGIGLGPVLGGLFVDLWGWRSVFWVTAPLGAVAFVLGLVRLPESRAARPRSLDPAGQLLVIMVLGSIAVCAIEAQRIGPVPTAAIGIAGALALVALLRWEGRRAEPLLDLRLFADGAFVRAFVTALLAFFGFAGLLFVQTMYLQNVIGLSPSMAGLLTLPLAGVVIVVSPVAGRLVAIGRARTALICGGAIMSCGAVGLASVAGSPVWLSALPLGAFGLGYGLLNDPVNVIAVSELPLDQAAVAAGVMSTAKQVGQMLGVAVIGAIAASVAVGDSPAEFRGSYLAVCGVLAASGGAIAVLHLTARSRS